MTLAGWIMLILSWGLIIALNVFCFVKVFGQKDDERKKSDPSSRG